jgi:hypothetical protein
LPSSLARSGREKKAHGVSKRRRVGPFLKEFVKRKRFSSDRVRNGSAERGSRPFRVGWSRSMRRLSLFGLRLGCRRYGKLPSFFSSAIAPNSFLRKVPLTITVSSSARSRVRADADVSGANSSPVGPLHTQRRAGRLPPALTRAAASKDRLELALTGGISSCLAATPIEQPGRSWVPLFSSLVCPVRQPLRGAYNTSDLGGG